MKSAVGNFNGETELYYDFESSGMASLSKRRLDHFDIKFNESEVVNVTTLDSWTSLVQVIPEFMKIDVEGHELDVLKGALEIISRVKLIQFEFGGCNIDTRTYFQDFYYFFKDLDFQLYRITPNGLLQIQQYSEDDEYFGTTNYLALNQNL